MIKKNKTIVLFALLVPFFAVLAAVMTVPFLPHTIEQTTFKVSRNQSLRQILAQANRQGVVLAPKATEILARTFGLTQPKHGIYIFTTPQSDWAILKQMQLGQVATTTVTLLEGWTASEMATAYSNKNIVSAEEFLAATQQSHLLQAFSIPVDEAEGYLYPESYHFTLDVDAQEVVKTMLTTFFKKIPANYQEQAEAVGLTLHQAVILASIIEKETQLAEEAPYVSAVFHNRLKAGMPLQADPTAIYRMPGYDGNLTRKHLQTPTPYNTYTQRGLPAGPIGNPAITSLLAAVNPAKTNALYFVANPKTGQHIFADTYEQHRQNVARYQQMQ